MGILKNIRDSVKKGEFLQRSGIKSAFNAFAGSVGLGIIAIPAYTTMLGMTNPVGITALTAISAGVGAGAAYATGASMLATAFSSVASSAAGTMVGSWLGSQFGGDGTGNETHMIDAALAAGTSYYVGMAAGTAGAVLMTMPG